MRFDRAQRGGSRDFSNDSLGSLVPRADTAGPIGNGDDHAIVAFDNRDSIFAAAAIRNCDRLCFETAQTCLIVGGYAGQRIPRWTTSESSNEPCGPPTPLSPM